MTFREKLEKEHPELVDDIYGGGCCNCPDDFGYEKNSIQLCNKDNICRKCWDREMPAHTKQTNGDRIRSMSDEELAEFLREYFTCEHKCGARADACVCDCFGAIEKWLQSESEEQYAYYNKTGN